MTNHQTRTGPPLTQPLSKAIYMNPNITDSLTTSPDRGNNLPYRITHSEKQNKSICTTTEQQAALSTH